MKKSLLALAILGAFAGAASAQSSVTVYGLVDTGFTNIDQGGDAGSINGIESGNDGASRIGFKGVEDLGNGLKAEFTLENGFNSDDGSGKVGQAFSRLAFVGLNGGFGKVRLGKQNTQVKDMLGQIDPFGAAGIVNSVDFINGGGLDQRNPNQVAWLSNNYAGFSGGVAYQFGESEDNGDNRGYSARLGYKNGPLNVQFGYQNQNSTNAGGDFDVSNATLVGGVISGVTLTGPEDVDQKNALLGATYDFGVVKLHGIYGEKKTDDNLADTSEKIRSALIGVTVPMGASAIRAEYIRNDNKDIDNADSNVWAVSYTYAMSKRTHLYATYVRTSNDDGSALGIGGPGEAEAGESARAIAVGVAHKF